MRRGAAPLALVALLAGGIPLAGCRGGAGSPRKESLARLPATVLPNSISVSGDLAHHAYLVEEKDGVHMVRDGVAGPPYRSASNRSFAPGSALHVFWARDRGEQPLVVVDGVPFPIGYSRHEYVVFDPTGAHWAVLGTAADQSSAVVIADGRTAGPFADASIPAWSPSGTLAYLRAHGATDTERRIELVVGDAVRRTARWAGGTCLPLLAEPMKGPELPRYAAVRYLADRRLLVLMPQDGGWALTRDDAILATFDASGPASPGAIGPYTMAGADACAAGSVVAATTLTTAESAPVAAWWERTAGPAGSWRVMVDGVPAADVRCIRPWPHQPPQLGADGRTVAFPCVERFDHRGEAIVVVHGDRRWGPYPEVWALALSADGRRLAYGASDGSHDRGWAVFADGVQQSPRYYAVWRPRFDASGTHLAWEAMRTARGPNELVLDGRRLATFDDLIDGPLYDRPGEVGWVIRRKRRLARLNFPLPHG